MFNLLAAGVIDEIRRQVTAVELHAFHDVELVGETRTFLNRDHAFLADLLHRIGNDFANFRIRVGRDRADLCDGFLVFAGLGECLQLRDDGRRRLVDTALEIHRVHAGGNRLQTLAQDRLGENRGGRGAVTGNVGSLRCHFLDHLRTHVLELVVELDFLCHRNAVLGDGRCAEALVQHDVAALGTQRHLDGIGQRVDAGEHLLPRIVAKTYFFSSHLVFPLE